MESRGLTELEGTVLGVVWSRQPCTPYQVRREFTESPSPYWSGSAGAIYPLMVRLEDAGFVTSEAHATGSRKSRRYTLTPSGRGALSRWVGPPVSDLAAGVPPDPLRTRIAFMSVLPKARREKLLEDIQARMKAFLALSEKDQAAGRGNAYDELMTRGAVMMQRTRLEWIQGVIASMKDGSLEWPKPEKRAKAASGR